MGFLCQYDRREGRDTVWSVLYDTASGTLLRAEATPAASPFSQTPGSRFVPDSYGERPSAAPVILLRLSSCKVLLFFCKVYLTNLGVT